MVLDKKTSDSSGHDVGEKIRVLRQRCGLSVRKLAELSGVTAGMISCVERQKVSPSLATLHKILSALGTNLAALLGGESDPGSGPVFVRERMTLVTDSERSYTIVFPRSEDIHVEMTDKQILPSRKKTV